MIDLNFSYIGFNVVGLLSTATWFSNYCSSYSTLKELVETQDFFGFFFHQPISEIT